MENYEFRGQRKDNKEWVYGDYYKKWIYRSEDRECGWEHYISWQTRDKKDKHLWNEYAEVIPETVGQYVGIDDIDKNKIYEGDILKSIHTVTMLVLMEKGHCKAKYQDHNNETWKDMFEQNWVYIDDLNVIGNKFDNPELLEVKKND